MANDKELVAIYHHLKSNPEVPIQGQHIAKMLAALLDVNWEFIWNSDSDAYSELWCINNIGDLRSCMTDILGYDPADVTPDEDFLVEVSKL